MRSVLTEDYRNSAAYSFLPIEYSLFTEKPRHTEMSIIITYNYIKHVVVGILGRVDGEAILRP